MPKHASGHLGGYSDLGEVAYWLALFLLIFYTSLTILSPLLIQLDNKLLFGMGAADYIFNIIMCHQLPERSVALFGQYMSICARDTAIFLGAILALLLLPMSSRLPGFLKSKYFALLSLVPIGIDGTAQLFGLWEGTMASRLATGLLAGFAVIYFVAFTFFGEPTVEVQRLKKPFAIFLLFFLLVSAVSLFVGNNYQTKSDVLEKTLVVDNASYVEVFYIAPHAFSTTIKDDMYINNYKDVVIGDILSMNTSDHPFGAWAVLMLDEKPVKEGKYVFISHAKGRYYYYDALTGSLIEKAEH